MNTYMEELEEPIAKMYAEFVKFCKRYNIRYSIVTDERDIQRYQIKPTGPNTDISSKVTDLRGHMEKEARKNGVVIDYDESHRDGPLFSFTLEALVDRKQSFDEDQLKSPDRKHLRSQSYFPSSFDKTTSFGGVKIMENFSIS